MEVLHNDLIPMVVSLILGTLVGLERQMGRKPAGLRTHVLVCIGSTMFVLTSGTPAERACSRANEYP